MKGDEKMGPSIAYFFKRIYGNVIKWWFAIYNPVVRRVWPTKEEEEAALAEEAENENNTSEDNSFGDEELSADYVNDSIDYGPAQGFYEETTASEPAFEEPVAPAPKAPKVNIEDCNYNATTGAYSGLYGTGPVDSATQSMLDEIMGKNKSAHSIDDLLPGNEPDYIDPESDAVTPPEDQQAILDEANAIYERLMREAAEDEAKKQAEIDAAKAAQG